MSSSEVSSTTSTKKKRRFLSSFLQRFGSCSEKADAHSVENGTSTNVVESNKALSTASPSGGDTVTIKNEKLVPATKLKQRSNSSLSTASTMTLNLECPLCLITQPMDNFPRLSTCVHYSCMECLRQYLTIEITESRVNVTCPECQERLHPTDMKYILSNDQPLVEKWEEFMLRRTLSVDPDCRWCPAPDCGYAVIAQSCASCPKLVCERPGCGTSFCYHCRQEWHPDQTCDAAHLQRTRQIRLRNNSVACSQSDEIKPCPKCGALIVKMNDGSCNHMTCTVCDAEFCWLCLQEITDLHYLSPSGCTFWGKKPWSRKKKILWQLGLLIGAPLGIALVAGVAVPAIIIGLPFWVARKTISQLKKRDGSKHRRNLLVVSCVAGSVLLSPPLAALTVGIGVPVMLIYVYGVVPFSLCRTGSYGLGSGADRMNGLNMANLDARFQRLDAVVRGTAGGSGNNDVTGVSSASGLNGKHHASTSRGHVGQGDGTSPSIGGTSEGGITMGSLNLSHSSNLDKLARPDHDASSTIAIAGSSITGSISGISGIGVANRLDIQNGCVGGKDVDQQSNNFSISSSHTCTSVQVLVHPGNQDSISEQGFSANHTSHSSIKKTPSSKSLGARRKTKVPKSPARGGSGKITRGVTLRQNHFSSSTGPARGGSGKITRGVTLRQNIFSSSTGTSPSFRLTYEPLKRSNTLDDKSMIGDRNTTTNTTTLTTSKKCRNPPLFRDPNFIRSCKEDEMREEVVESYKSQYACISGYTETPTCSGWTDNSVTLNKLDEDVNGGCSSSTASVTSTQLPHHAMVVDSDASSCGSQSAFLPIHDGSGSNSNLNKTTTTNDNRSADDESSS